MVVVYVAGPFSGPTAWDIAENIRAAERVGLLVALAGAMPLIPHANTAYFHGQKDTQFWIDGTLELQRRCDGSIFLPRWKESEGSRGEWADCEANKRPHMSLIGIDPEHWKLAIQDYVTWLEYERNGQVNQPKE